MFRCLVGLSVCILIAGPACVSPNVSAIVPAGDARLARLFEDYWQTYLRENPTRATYLGDHRYDDRLEDLSEPARLRAIDARKKFLIALDALTAGTTASAADDLNARIFRVVLEQDLVELDSPARFMPVRQQYGPQITLPLLQLSQPMVGDEAIRNYTARLVAFPAQVDVAIESMREGMRRGLVLPRIIVEKTLPGIDAQIRTDPTQSDLYKAYADKQPANASATRSAHDAQVRDAVRKAVNGYERLARFLREEYLPACRSTVGIVHLPGGAEWYAREARYHTTTDKSPREMHQIGLDELRRIHAEMRGIMHQVGNPGDDGQAFFRHLRDQPDQHFKSADEMLTDFAAVLKRSDANLPRLFGRLPKTPYTLHEMEPFRASAAPAAYYYQAPDEGDRPAYFYVNTYRPTERPRYTMEALAYHEAMPGHHLQIALAQENTSLPQFRRHASFTVFIEGWGLYSEVLGHDLGGYRDPYQEFGRLTFDAWRSCRLVVDTGMHAHGWTREQAIDFMCANTALARLDVESEIDRYIAWPGQALAYKIGQLEIARMRRDAESRLGARFDIRAFHDKLLSEGALPLNVLQEQMSRWLDAQSGGPKGPAPRQ